MTALPAAKKRFYSRAAREAAPLSDRRSGTEFSRSRRRALVVFLYPLLADFNGMANLRLNEFLERIVSGTTCWLFMPVVQQAASFQVQTKLVESI